MLHGLKSSKAWQPSAGHGQHCVGRGEAASLVSCRERELCLPHLVNESVGLGEVLRNVLIHIIIQCYSLVAEAASMEAGHHRRGVQHELDACLL